MARYKCPKCGREYETHAYCNHHRVSVKCTDCKSGKGGLFGDLSNLPDTTPPNTLKGLKYR